MYIYRITPVIWKYGVCDKAPFPHIMHYFMFSGAMYDIYRNVGHTVKLTVQPIIALSFNALCDC